jgi:hypothetical protein
VLDALARVTRRARGARIAVPRATLRKPSRRVRVEPVRKPGERQPSVPSPRQRPHPSGPERSAPAPKPPTTPKPPTKKNS